MKPRGFTLIELLLVVSVIGILVAVAVPGYQAVVFRSRAAEPRLMLQAIADAELAYFRDHGRFIAAGHSTGDGKVPTRPARFETSGAGWRELGLRADGPVRYRYSVSVSGDSFVALASGDLDADGQQSSFQLDGRTLAVSVKDELE